MFEQYEIEPNIAVNRFLKLFDVEAPETFVRQKHIAGIKGLEPLERRLSGSEWLVGNHCSVADISLYAYTHLAGEGGFDLSRYAGIRSRLERVATQPGQIRIIE